MCKLVLLFIFLTVLVYISKFSYAEDCIYDSIGVDSNATTSVNLQPATNTFSTDTFHVDFADGKISVKEIDSTIKLSNDQKGKESAIKILGQAVIDASAWSITLTSDCDIVLKLGR